MLQHFTTWSRNAANFSLSLPGLNPWTFGPMASTLTLAPPGTTLHVNKGYQIWAILRRIKHGRLINW
jgi:hypothetical protein